MRCYFMRHGHIGNVEVIADTSDDAAIKQAQALFEKRKREFEGFELWDRARFVYRYPMTPAKIAS